MSFEFGEPIRTDYGFGFIEKPIERGNRPWTHEVYYFVKLNKYPKPHLFSQAELQKHWMFK
jgi:hypothetical protein